ncbi:MAG: hypothetical protein U1F77_00615 [Kiritimatiellia bacterium]
MKLSLKQTEATPTAADQLARIPKPPKFRPVKVHTGTSATLLFFGGLFIAAGMGALFIYNFVEKAGWIDLDPYKWFRLILILTFAVILIGTAFQQNPFHGMLCIICPPYILAYAIAFLDSPALKGLVVGLMAWLGAEMYYMKDHSFVNAARQTAENTVRSVNGMIDRASR